MQITCKDTGEQFLNYKDYLKGLHWSIFKTKYFQYHKKECSICGKKYGIQLHHLTYDNIGNETFDDVICVCGECHDKIHEELKYNKNLNNQIKKCKSVNSKSVDKKKYKKEISTKKEKHKSKKNKSKYNKNKIQKIYTSKNIKYYYAVKHPNGDMFIFDSWANAEKKINKISNVIQQRFSSEKEAFLWLNTI